MAMSFVERSAVSRAAFLSGGQNRAGIHAWRHTPVSTSISYIIVGHLFLSKDADRLSVLPLPRLANRAAAGHASLQVMSLAIFKRLCPNTSLFAVDLYACIGM